MSPLLTGAKAASDKSARSRNKCCFCRQKKVKCLPEQRDFSQGEKCTKCKKSGDPCGPNVRAQESQSNLEAQLTTSQPNHIPLGPPAEFTVESVNPALRPVIIQDSHSPHSSSTTPSQMLRPGDSSDDTSQDGNPTDFEKAKCRLRKMGFLIDLYGFIQHRRRAFLRMKEALLLQNIAEYDAALTFFLQVTGHCICKFFRETDHIRSSLKSAEWELVSRRMRITGQLYLDIHETQSAVCDVPESFRKAHANLKDELSSYYQKLGDGTEADRLRFQRCETSAYLANCPLQVLNGIVERISKAMKYVLEDIPQRYQALLNIERPINVTPAHLAIMSGRQNGSIEPTECAPGFPAGITSRNGYHLAAEVGDDAYLTSILSNPCDETIKRLSERDAFGLTPLMIAAYSGKLEVFETLVASGASLREQAPDARSILSLACIAGNVDIVKYILQKGIGIRDFILFCSPLHEAAAAGRDKVVQLLVERGADPNEKFSGWTAAERAASNGHINLAKDLDFPADSFEQYLSDLGYISRKRKWLCGPTSSIGDPEQTSFQIHTSPASALLIPLPIGNLTADEVRPRTMHTPDDAVNFDEWMWDPALDPNQVMQLPPGNYSLHSSTRIAE